MKSSVAVGYEVPSGACVTVPVDHTLITGRTQQSGKTTLAEAMAHRVGCPVLTFLTKPDEKGFRDATVIPPYSRDRADWEFVVSILEASLKKPSLKKGWIMRLCEAGNFKKATWKKPRTLADVLANCETAMGKGGSLELTELRGYLRKVVPTMDGLEFSSKLRLGPGINVMDLRGVALPAQFLIMNAALEWVYQHGQRMIVLIPEAQKFFPRDLSTPVKAAGERIIQEKGAAKVFLWLDTQMMRNVDPVIRGQMGVWLFGVQRDVNEARRTIEHIPEEPDGPPRPSLAQLQRLRRGFFIAAWGQTLVPEFYVQPFWVGDVHARAIAVGEERVDSAEDIWDERSTGVQDFTAEDAKDAEGGDDEEEALTAEGAEGAEEEAEIKFLDERLDLLASDHNATNSPSSATVQNSTQDSSLSEGDEEAEAVAAGLSRQINPEEGAAMDAQEKELLELARSVGMDVALRELRARAEDAQGYAGIGTSAGAAIPPGQPAAFLDSPLDSPQVGNKGARGGDARAGGETAAASGSRPLQVSGAPASTVSMAAVELKANLEAVYRYVKDRAQKEAPAILALLAQQPELRLKIERPVIPAEGVLVPLAKLLHEGFFANGAGKRSKAVEKEFSRRGWPEARPTIYKGMMELCRLGFLTREEVGKREYEYHAVPGMKIEVER